MGDLRLEFGGGGLEGVARDVGAEQFALPVELLGGGDVGGVFVLGDQRLGGGDFVAEEVEH